VPRATRARGHHLAHLDHTRNSQHKAERAEKALVFLPGSHGHTQQVLVKKGEVATIAHEYPALCQALTHLAGCESDLGQADEDEVGVGVSTLGSGVDSAAGCGVR